MLRSPNFTGADGIVAAAKQWVPRYSCSVVQPRISRTFHHQLPIWLTAGPTHRWFPCSCKIVHSDSCQINNSPATTLSQFVLPDVYPLQTLGKGKSPGITASPEKERIDALGSQVPAPLMSGKHLLNVV